MVRQLILKNWTILQIRINNVIMKYISYYILLTFLFYGCISRDRQRLKDSYIENKFLKMLSSEKIYGNIPSRFAPLILYVKYDSTTIVETNVDMLRNVYNDRFTVKYKTFYSFLAEALNQKIYFKNCLDYKLIPLDNNIVSIYKKYGFPFLKKKYYKSNKLIINSQLPLNKTVLYYFFINNYITTIDDYVGIYHIVPINELKYEKLPANMILNRPPFSSKYDDCRFSLMESLRIKRV